MYLHYLHISWCYVIKKNNMPFHTIIPIENPKHHLIPRFHFNQTNLCFVFILQNYQIDSAILLWNKSIHYVVICFEGKSKCILTFMPWKHFPRYCPVVRGIHWSHMDSPHKGQRRGALRFSLICTWTNNWENNRYIGDLTSYHAHFDVTVMSFLGVKPLSKSTFRAATDENFIEMTKFPFQWSTNLDVPFTNMHQLEFQHG